MSLQKTIQKIRRRLNLSTSRALLGNDSGTIYEVDTNGVQTGRYYARIELSPNRLDTARPFDLARSASFRPLVNRIVIIGTEDGREVILGEDTQATRAQGDNPGGFNMADPNFAGLVQKERIYPFFCTPVASASEPFYVRVYPDNLSFGDNVKVWGGGTIDLLAEQPAAGNHQYTIVSWLPTTNALEFSSSTPQADSSALDSTDLQEAIDNKSTDAMPLWAFVLDGDDSVLSANNSIDLRPIFLPSELYQAKTKLGFVNRTDSTLSYDSGTRTLTLASAVGGVPFEYYTLGGVLHSTTATFQLTHTNATDGYFFYFDENNTFTVSTTAWDLLTDTPVAFVYYSLTLTDGLAFEERHNDIRNPNAHLELHEQIGTYKVSGFGASDYTLLPSPPPSMMMMITLFLWRLALWQMRTFAPHLRRLRMEALTRSGIARALVGNGYGLKKYCHSRWAQAIYNIMKILALLGN